MVGVVWYIYIHTYVHMKRGPRWRCGYFEEPLGREGGREERSSGRRCKKDKGWRGRKEYTEVRKGREGKGGRGRKRREWKGREPRRVGETGGSTYPTRWRNGQVAISRCHNYKAERGFKRGDMDPLSVWTASSEATEIDKTISSRQSWMGMEEGRAGVGVEEWRSSLCVTR